MKNELISKTVYRFYEKATKDILIGHHFRKIQEFSGDNVLSPPMEAFSHHLPRINQFWEIQLLGKSTLPLQAPFNLINVHEYLHIRTGEVNRWVTLFQETLKQMKSEYPDYLDFFNDWDDRIKIFQNIFLKSKIIIH